MSTKWTKTRLKTLLSTVIFVYVCMGVALFKKSTHRVPFEDNGEQEIKTIISYSQEYQMEKIFRESTNCENYPEIPLMSSEPNSLNFEYYENLGGYLVSSFFDDRLKDYHFIRTVALLPNNMSLYCQVWKKEKVTSHKALVHTIWPKNWDSSGRIPYVPSLISCPVKSDEKNLQISFSKEPCEPTKKIIVQRKTPRKNKIKFAICLKPLNFTKNILQDLRTWFRINLQLGVENFTTYLSKDGSIRDYLYKLRKKGFLDVIEVFDGGLSTGNRTFEEKLWLRRKLEVVFYNDCFYRNFLRSVDFVIPLDIDEIIVPKNARNFEGILHEFLPNMTNFSCLSARNFYFFEKFSKNLVKQGTKFNRVLRSSKISPSRDSTKSLIYVPNTLTILHHFSFEPLIPGSRQILLPTNIAQLNHYRDECDSNLIDDCYGYLQSAVYDDSLIRFQNRSRGV